MQAEIARRLGVHRSTISRELRRTTGQRGYRPKQANDRAHHRLRLPRNPRKIVGSLQDEVKQSLRMDDSPEQIAGQLKQRPGITVSHECIYQHILADKRKGGQLYQHLRLARKKKRKRYGVYAVTSPIERSLMTVRRSLMTEVE